MLVQVGADTRYFGGTLALQVGGQEGTIACLHASFDEFEHKGGLMEGLLVVAQEVCVSDQAGLGA